MMFILYYIFNNEGNLFVKLNTYNNFACKYIVLSIITAVIIPYFEFFIRNKIKLHLPILTTIPKFPYWKFCVGLYAALLFFLNFIRIFDNNFWGDETTTINHIMSSNFTSITTWAAEDVHPPLYYYMLKIVYMIIGNHGWAYHLLSLLPCLFIIILSLTVFWKEFGGKVSVILITFIGLSYNAVYYNVEVRMYSWAGLFVLLSYYGLWKILKYQRKQDYIFFIFFSLSASYTHYFSMVTVAFFYLVVMIIALLSRQLSIKAVVITWISTIIGYLPWAIKFLKTVQRTADSYWVIGIPTFKSALYYLFSSRFSTTGIWIVLFVVIITFFIYETKILTIIINKEKQIDITVAFDQITISNIVIFISAGIFCVLGTIIFAISYSHIIRPIFTHRYIYATSIVAWMVLAIVVSKLKLGKIWIILLCSFLLAGFIPRYQEIYMREKQDNDILQDTLKVMENINSNDIILTNNSHIHSSIIRYYFPDINAQILDENTFAELDKDLCYYLIVSNKTDMDAIFQAVEDSGFHYLTIVNEGNFGTNIVNIYQIKN